MTATQTRPAPAAPPAAARPASRRTHDVRRTLLALLASCLGAFPLCEMFVDTGWLVDVWLTMAIVVAPAALLRRTRPAGAGQIWIGVALMVPWLTLTFLHGHAVLGFVPLRGTWHDLSAALSSLHHTTTVGVAPIHTTVPVRLAICALLGLVAALVDLLAVVGRHGALAGVPLLVVFTVSGAVPRHPVTWVWFVLSAVGFLILLALDSSDDVQRWGYVVPRSRGSKRRARLVSGQRIAVIAIALALAVPVFIPSDSRNLLTKLFHNGGGNGEVGFGADLNGTGGANGIDPFAALHGELVRDRPVPLLQVKVSSPDGTVGAPGGVQPFYLRTNVLSNFEGDGWRPGDPGTPEPLDATKFESTPGSPFVPSVKQFSAQIDVTGLRSNPPVFASPVAVYGVNSGTEWNPHEMLLVDSNLDSGQVLTEEVAQPEPTVQQLRAARPQHDPALAGYLRLPSIRAYVRTLTARVISGAETPYDRARAIMNFFTNRNNGFTYSLVTTNGDSGDELTDFLRNRVGYCQQYAAAMGVMLRLAGVPSRVVLGYAHGVPDNQGRFTVTTFDAHAWVEAYFGGIGWIPFDPTPLAGISGGSQNDLPWATHERNSSQVDIGPPHPSATAGPVKPSSSPGVRRRHSSASSGGPLAGPAIALTVLIVLVAAAAAPAAARWQRRRRRLGRIRRGDTDALWAELADTTVDLGYVWSAARTPRQVAHWLGTSADSAADSVRAITTAVERARYSPGGTADAGSDLVAQLAQVRSGLGRRRSPRERMRARFWPASLNWSRARWIGRWLPGAGQRH